MKLTTLLLVVSLMQVSASSLAQKITLHEKNVSLESVLEQIGQQSGYGIFFDAKTISEKQKIDIAVDGVSVEQAVTTALSGLDLTYTVHKNVITISRRAEPSFLDRVKAALAAIDVRGKVVDSLGNGLAGATVMVKNGRASTSTDAGGNFLLKGVDEGAVLVVTYMGYVTREVTTIKEFTIITLKESRSKLDEVQVIAYGTTTQRLNTGNVVSIKAADIEKQPVNNPLLSLVGRVPGLLINQINGFAGGQVDIQIRGRNTLRGEGQGNADPLVVVDGLPVQNNIQGLGYSGLPSLSSISFINPNDIESIDVLKDADATSIYGSRGANGVVLITTKKGKAGEAAIVLNLQSGFGQVPHKMKLLNTEQYLTLRKEAYANSGRDLSTLPHSRSAADVTLWPQTRYTDWQEKLIGGKAHYDDFQGSVSGGQSNILYNVGGNYHRETTVFRDDNSDQRGSAHLSLTGSSNNKKFKTTITASYMADRNTLPGVDFTSAALSLAPNAPAPYNSDGSLNWEPYPSGNSSWGNPYAELMRTYKAKIKNLLASTDIGYKFNEELAIKAQLAYNDLVGSSVKIDPMASRPPEEVDPIAISDFYNNNMSSLSFEPQLTYEKHISRGTIKALVGGTYQSTETTNQHIFSAGYTSDEFIESLALANPLYYGADNNYVQYKYAALFARVNYNWKNKYIVNVSGRRDGSSRFGPGKQFGNFGSAGLAWIFSEEAFVKSALRFLSYGKIRMSYGTSGNDGIGDYKYLELYQANQGRQPYQGIKGFATNGLFNSDYHWETTKKFEVGLEMGFLADRILINAAYFRNRSDNQLLSYQLPAMSGPGSYISNLPALIQNTGLEFSAQTRNISGKAFNWTTSFTLTRNRNKLVDFPGLASSPYYNMFEIGAPFYGVVRVYSYAGVNPGTGQYQFKDSNGKIVDDPEVPGRLDNGQFLRIMTTPKFYGSVSNSLSYKGFSLDFLFQFTKQTGINPILAHQYFPGLSGNLPVEFANQRWRQAGDIALFQKVYVLTPDSYRKALNDVMNSDAFYTDASFIRLKNLHIEYTLPTSILSKTGMKSFSLYLQGQNVFTITGYKGLDPETQSKALPPLRVITAGVKVKM